MNANNEEKEGLSCPETKEITFRVSYFDAPIASYRDAEGRFHMATLMPSRTLTLEEVHRLVSGDAALKEAHRQVLMGEEYRTAKTRALPYVLPYGVFGKRIGEDLRSLSGVFPIDIDQLTNVSEAEELRDKLWEDPWLRPVLAFTSPSRRGVKLFMEYANLPYLPAEPAIFKEWLRGVQEWCQEYIEDMYLSDRAKCVDRTGSDWARACFLCHDPSARYRPPLGGAR